MDAQELLKRFGAGERDFSNVDLRGVDLREAMTSCIVAPMTTKGRAHPTRVPCHFQGKDYQIVLDQIRTVDKTHLVRLLGSLNRTTQKQVLAKPSEMFAE